MHFEMRSSSFRNSAVSSSSFGLEGGLWRGNTSDIGLSLCPRPRCTSFSPAIAAFLRRTLFNWLGIRNNYFQFGLSDADDLDQQVYLRRRPFKTPPFRLPLSLEWANSKKVSVSGSQAHTYGLRLGVSTTKEVYPPNALKKTSTSLDVTVIE